MDQIYGVYTNEITKLEKQNRKLARIAAQEGFVLLRNNGALPLESKKIALFGMGARKTVKGGLGSGSVEERYSVTIEEGLKNAGYEITTNTWLNDYDNEVNQTYQKWHDMVESKLEGLTNPMEIIPIAHSFVYRYPSGRVITTDDIKNSDTDTAIYVLMRQAGEGNDRRLEKGDFLITDIERENLELVAENYTHTIVVINIGGGIDMQFVEEISGIDALIFFVQGGMEGGNALADVLSGKANFSGKLADTVAKSYNDVPFGNEFSYLNGNLENEYYKEGIYVGYRYYDSFDVPVQYPFGFGLSYTDFELITTNVKADGTHIITTVKVTNKGDKYSGKEVIQLYLSAPDGEMIKEYQSLVAFEKTKNLAPLETQEVIIDFDLTTAASYDEKNAAWILEKGEFILRIGNSSKNTSVAAVISLDESITTVKTKNFCVPTDQIKEIKPSKEIQKKVNKLSTNELKKAKHIIVDKELFNTRIIDYSESLVEETIQVKEILDKLTIEEIVELTCGGEIQKVTKEALEIHGAAGKTTTALLDKGIRNIIMADGPAGINIVNKVKYRGDGEFAVAMVPERYQWGAMKKKFAHMIPEDGQMIYRYATAWPVEMLLAQTWNTELLERIGVAVGKEMELYGITLWLAPGMNIHRNPLGGRNFEYYSEDPVVSGKLAAAITRGVQKESGLGTVVKHFCCNDSEDNRNHSSSNVSERALREIHLKGFEIAVKMSQPKAIMSSYNMINHVYTPNSYELLTEILRCEWGFKGLVMTDWMSCNKTAGKAEKCAIAGNDLIMPGGKDDIESVLKALHNGNIKKEEIRKCACRVLRMMLNAKIPVLIK